MNDEIQPIPSPPTRAEVIGKIVGRITHEAFGTGPLAELRRLDPTSGRLSEPALHRLLARHVPGEWVNHSCAVSDWALIIHCLALAAPDHLRDAPRLGRALHDAGFGETRFVNLLDATADELRVRLPRTVRFLVHRGGRLHGPQLADFVLTPAEWDFHDTLRQRIAADYYRAEHKAAQAETAAS